MLSAVPHSSQPGPGLASTEEIIEEIRRGHIVVLVDDEDRENEGDLIFAADFVTPEKINFLAKHGRGLICMPITAEHAAQLALAPMTRNNKTVHGTNFTVAIEAAEGVTTGISAADRAHTIRVASRPHAQPGDIVQPGHVFPLVAAAGGVLMRAGHTEACCDLARLAGLTPAAVLCEVMNDDGTMARLPDLLPFASKHGLKVGTIADLIHYRAANESMVERVGSAHGPHCRRSRSNWSPTATSRAALRTWRWCMGSSRRRRKRWCACTNRCRCSTCSTPMSRSTRGRCRRRCGGSPPVTAACSSCSTAPTRRSACSTSSMLC